MVSKASNGIAARLSAVFAVMLTGLLGVRAAIALEEPSYTVVENRDGYEVRHYEPSIVAEFEFAAPSERSAGGNAFRALAAYIFGDNRQRTKMAMTAPVETSLAPRPAAAAEAEGNHYVYSFVMERRYTADTLPEPLDPRIRIRERPARYVAALSFSGNGSEERFRRYRNKLVLLLRGDGVSTTSGYSLARYDRPSTPSSLKRNEVLVDIDWREHRAAVRR